MRVRVFRWLTNVECIYLRIVSTGECLSWDRLVNVPETKRRRISNEVKKIGKRESEKSKQRKSRRPRLPGNSRLQWATASQTDNNSKTKKSGRVAKKATRQSRIVAHWQKYRISFRGEQLTVSGNGLCHSSGAIVGRLAGERAAEGRHRYRRRRSGQQKRQCDKNRMQSERRTKGDSAFFAGAGRGAAQGTDKCLPLFTFNKI